MRDDELARWAAELLADEAIAARSRAWWLARQAEEEAGLVGVLVDLAEAGAEVVLTTAAGSNHRGPLVAVAEGFVAVATPAGTVLVALGGVAVVRAQGRSRVAQDDREAALALSLAEALARLVGERPQVRLALAGAPPVAGELAAVGTDVVSLRSGPGEVVHVALARVVEVLLA